MVAASTTETGSAMIVDLLPQDDGDAWDSLDAETKRRLSFVREEDFTMGGEYNALMARERRRAARQQGDRDPGRCPGAGESEPD